MAGVERAGRSALIVMRLVNMGQRQPQRREGEGRTERSKRQTAAEWVREGRIGDIAQMDGVIWASETDLPAILELDHAASQMDRSSLYNALMTTGRFAIFGGPQRITGCAAVRRFGRGKVIGPVVAQSNSDAKRLISFVMSQTTGQHIRIDTDTDQGLGPWLVQCGLPKTGSGVRMQKGARLMQKTEPATIFALASQALG